MYPPDPATARRPGDPCAVADIVLAVALRSGADAVFIEPTPQRDDSYSFVFEAGSTLLSTVNVDAALGSAVIARLAILADLDLAAAGASTGVVPVRSGACATDVVVTVRPGSSVRADLMVLRRDRQRISTGAKRDLVAGDVVDHYRVLDKIGGGGMGIVYRVEHLALARQHALKVLTDPELETDPGALQQFLREGRAAARIRHPHIAEVFDFGQLPDGRPYLVMELVVGRRLVDLIARGPLQPSDAVAAARQLANALAEAHDRGVIHADVTPANVLVEDGPAMHVKLIDFGLAKLVGEYTHDSDAKFVFGTPHYISPEQLRGGAPSERSDQYGLGIVLYELLVGRPPFDHADLKTLLAMHMTAPVPAIESPHGPLPARLVEVVSTCLQKSPDQRFPGMRALAAALDEVERVTNRNGWRRWLSS